MQFFCPVKFQHLFSPDIITYGIPVFRTDIAQNLRQDLIHSRYVKVYCHYNIVHRSRLVQLQISKIFSIMILQKSINGLHKLTITVLPARIHIRHTDIIQITFRSFHITYPGKIAFIILYATAGINATEFFVLAEPGG